MLPVQSGVKQQCPASCVCALWHASPSSSSSSESVSGSCAPACRARSSEAEAEAEAAAAVVRPASSARPTDAPTQASGRATPTPLRPSLEQLHPFLLYYEKLVQAARLEQRGACCLPALLDGYVLKSGFIAAAPTPLLSYIVFHSHRFHAIRHCQSTFHLIHRSCLSFA